MRSSVRHIPAVTEREVLAGVLDACRVLGIEANRQNTGAAMNPSGQTVRFGRKGNADISATIRDGPNRGKRVEIEVKRPGKTPTAEQWDRIHEVNASGGLSFWVDDAGEALRVLRWLVDGWHVVIDDNGDQWVTDEGGRFSG
jgi:hypothetical protein